MTEPSKSKSKPINMKYIYIAGGAAMGAIITFIINNYNKNKPKPMR